jgi:predicted Zn-dependent protease
MYKAGYDPTAFVDFFEKIETLEKRKPGTLSKVFSTHPPTDSRIQAAQKNIQMYLKAKPEYVLTTSEFNDVRGRLMAMHNKRKVDGPADPTRPTLRRAPGSGGGPVDADSTGNTTNSSSDDDDRPTLKRRPDSN